MLTHIDGLALAHHIKMERLAGAVVPRDHCISTCVLISNYLEDTTARLLSLECKDGTLIDNLGCLVKVSVK